MGWFGICGLAHAQNHNGVPLGGRTAMMGGAGVAAGNDSAMPYLNPAGLAGVPGDILGVSATVYGWGETRYDKAFLPGSTFCHLRSSLMMRQDSKHFSLWLPAVPFRWNR